MSQKKLKQKKRKIREKEASYSSFFYLKTKIKNWYQQNIVPRRDVIFTISIYFIVFLYSIHPETDRDWGWHLKYGEYFFTHGKLLNEDIYSSTLPGYHWVNHSWIYDLF